jgi:hypothetical protein
MQLPGLLGISCRNQRRTSRGDVKRAGCLLNSAPNEETRSEDQSTHRSSDPSDRACGLPILCAMVKLASTNPRPGVHISCGNLTLS